ncbi:hypothetical protein PR003_g23188 [Phytophthora rubi]|uniref:Uncharacterized protein n=1 Tax=Phytophthora rubi TaxID=129364 RepID=A0A6A4D1M1_9STRA|nr:hypothetical protein PR003_g23188 [Phytophthora rubi]
MELLTLEEARERDREATLNVQKYYASQLREKRAAATQSNPRDEVPMPPPQVPAQAAQTTADNHFAALLQATLRTFQQATVKNDAASRSRSAAQVKTEQSPEKRGSPQLLPNLWVVLPQHSATPRPEQRTHSQFVCTPSRHMADDSAATQQLLVSSTGDGEQTSASQGTPAALVTPLRLPSTSDTAQSDGSGQETTPTLMVSSASGLATSSASPPASGGMSTAATGSSSASTSSAVTGATLSLPATTSTPLAASSLPSPLTSMPAALLQLARPRGVVPRSRALLPPHSRRLPRNTRRH